MSATLTNWPVVTARPLSVRVPTPGRVSIFTSSRWLLSASVNPKSEVPNTLVACQANEAVSSAPLGAWLTKGAGGGGETGGGGGEAGVRLPRIDVSPTAAYGMVVLPVLMRPTLPVPMM